MKELRPKAEVRINNWLKWGLIGSVLLNIGVIASRWFTISPWLIGAIAAVAIVYIIAQLMQSQKHDPDMFDYALMIKNRKAQLKNFIPGGNLDTCLENMQAHPLSNIDEILEFKKPAMVFLVRQGRILGKYNTDFLTTIHSMEKSDLFKRLVDVSGQMQTVNKNADQLGLEAPYPELIKDEDDTEE